MADGSVEIKITGSVDPSVSASASEAKAAIGGLGASTAAAVSATQEAAIATVAQAAAFTSATDSVRGNTIAMRESLVVGREVLRGNLTRLPGSLSILAQQFAISGKSAGEFAASILKSFGLIKITQDAELAGLAASAAATAGVISETAARAGSAIVAADAEVLLAEAALKNAQGSAAETAAQVRLAAAHQAVAVAAREAGVSEAALAEANIGVAATARAAAAAEAVALGPIAALVGAAVGIGTVTLATISYEAEEKKLTETTVGLGAQSGLTAEQLKKIGESADSSSQSIRETTKAAEAFAATGLRDADTVKQLANSVEAFSQITGVKFAEAQKQLATAMQDPIKGAKDLHEQLGILDGDQLEQIQRLVELGNKDQAVAIIMQALKQRIDEAHQAGVGLRGEFGSLVDVLSNVYEKIGQVTEGFGREAETLLEDLIPALHQAGQAHRDAAAAASQQAQNEAELNRISAKGATAYDATPEGRAAKERADLQGNLSAARDALKVDTALHGANSEAVKRDRQAIDDYTHAVSTYLTPVEKKLKADQLDVQLAAARHAHNKQLVADLTEQKALIEESGKIESDADAKALAAGKGDVAGAKTFAPKGAGPSIVSEWAEQLHQREILSQDYFNDETANELKFWQDKLTTVSANSKAWLEVQSKIYDAGKKLAHQDYDEHIADLNDRIEADRGNFAQEQADWQEKLAFIKSKNGEESTAYKDAHRQMEAEARQHQEQMVQAELSGNSKEIEALKQHLAAMRQLRETDAKAAEALIKEQAGGSIVGDISAAIQIGQLHHQLAQQEIADAQAVFDKEDALRQQGLADMLTVMSVEDERYKNAKKAELAAEGAFQDQVRLLQARSTAQQIQDILAIKQAYEGYISGTVGATISGLDGMLSRTKSWQQAMIGVYQSLISTFENALGKMVTKWVVEHVFMTAAQRAQLAIQKTQHVVAEATKTGATTAGVATRAGVENTGFFAKLLSLLGISVGTHAGSETAKTGATVAGVTSRTAAETAGATSAAAAQIAANVSTALSYVGVAGAAGVASWAGAPWPIDAGAPAFGASMAGTAASFGSLASLDVGTNYLPRDQIVQAHEGERVIPKADNRKLMDVLQMATGGGRAASDVHLHSSPTFNGNIASWEDMVTKHERDMMRWLDRKLRNGAFNKALSKAA